MKKHLVMVLLRSGDKEVRTEVVTTDDNVWTMRAKMRTQIEREIQYGSLRSIRDLDWYIDSVEL